MRSHSKGALAPFFSPDLLEITTPRTRFEALLSHVLTSLQEGYFTDALLAAESVCRAMPAEYLPALLRAKIIELALPALASKAWFTAWQIAPDKAELQDQLLQAWLDHGAVEAAQTLALAVLDQRCKTHTEQSLIAILRQAQLAQFAACWKEQSSIIGVVFNNAPQTTVHATATLRLSNETHDFDYQVPANGQRFQITPPNLHDAWSLSFCCNEPLPQQQNNAQSWALASGSPLTFGAAESSARDTNSAQAPTSKRHTQAALPPQATSFVSIVIPVYRDVASVKACISSVLQSLPLNQTKAKIVIVDDNSPEPAVSAWLQSLSKQTTITVLKNRHNLGFIGSTNRGLRLHAEADALMLNADTVVHGNWLDRLVAALYRSENIASVVPWSNNAEITSLVKIAVASAAPTAEELRQIDTLAAHFHQQGAIHDAELPSCIGFAMLMRRTVMNEIGLLDAVHLARGYGEEVDWCLRARAAGYKHMAATGVFLAHTGSVSFRFEKTLRVKQNKRVLQQRYPQYELEYALFCRDDPLQHARSTLLNAINKQQIAWLKDAQERLEHGDAFKVKGAKHQANLGKPVPVAMPLPAPLPSANLRIAISNMHSGHALSHKVLQLARRIASQPDWPLRLLIFGGASEALWHTGVVDVLPPQNQHRANAPLFKDDELIGLGHCVHCWVLADETEHNENTASHANIAPSSLPITVVHGDLNVDAWLAQFGRDYFKPQLAE